jgi:hypothetical protein
MVMAMAMVLAMALALAMAMAMALALALTMVLAMALALALAMALVPMALALALALAMAMAMEMAMAMALAVAMAMAMAMAMADQIDEKTIRKFLWSEGDLSYKLDPLQVSISTQVRSTFDVAKRIGVLSSRQIGKSFWVVVFALEYLLRNPRAIVRVIAPTRDKCEEIVEDNLNVILLDAPEGYISQMRSKNRWNLHNGSSLRIGALERQYVDKNRGGNASVIIYEECGFVSGDDFEYGVNSVIGPQLIRSKGHEIFVSSPSEQPDHPLHTVIAPECEAKGTLFNYMVFESPSMDDTAIVEAAGRTGTVFGVEFVVEIRRRMQGDRKILAAEVVELARAWNIHLTDDFMREFLAMIIRPVTLMVIPVFHERETIMDFSVPPACRWQIIIDWGGVRDKTVALLMTYEYNSDCDMIWDERKWDENTGTDVIMKEIKESGWLDYIRLDQDPVWADVPGQLQIDLERDHNFIVHLPPKQNWLGSVNTMAARFATKNVKIKPRCKFLIASVRAGMLNKTKTDFERTKALGHMDALAALMYGIRVLNRESPYLDGYVKQTDNLFVNPDTIKKQEIEMDSNMLGLKTFGAGPRQFGSFKKK